MDNINLRIVYYLFEVSLSPKPATLLLIPKVPTRVYYSWAPPGPLAPSIFAIKWKMKNS